MNPDTLPVRRRIQPLSRGRRGASGTVGAVLHGLRHVFDPGTPTYAALKVSAVAGVAGAQVALRRRAKRRQADAEAAATAERAQDARRSPHPRSRKKKRRRR